MSLDRTDVKLLRLYVTVVESGGFSAAQGALNLSLATISGHIAALETRFGVTLCRRGRSGFRLTEAGRSVYDEVKSLLATIDQFDRRMTSLRNALGGTLAIGLTDNTITDPHSPIEHAISGFSDAAPGVTLTIVTRPPHELLRDLIAGQIKVAVASFPRLAMGLSSLDLYHEAQSLYCGAGHPLFGIDDTRLDSTAIRAHRMVGRSYWGARDLKPFEIDSPGAVVSDMEAEARLILSGRYLGYLPDHYARAFVEMGRVRRLRPDLFGYRALFQAVYDPSQATGPLVPLFLEMLGMARTAVAAPATPTHPASGGGEGRAEIGRSAP